VKQPESGVDIQKIVGLEHSERRGQAMQGALDRQVPESRRWVATAALIRLTGLLGLCALCTFPALFAQQQAPAAAPSGASSNGALPPPSVPIDQIIQKFAAREAEFKIERDNFTYTQTFSIQTLDNSGRPDGEYKMVSEIVFTPAGKRFERVTYAPTPTLERIQMSQQDFDDLEHVQPFVLTTPELPKYDIKYVDHERLDELGTYVFEVGPKTMEKNQRYFQGRVWVDDKDYEIVKTDGKAVPDVRKKGQENVFPRFETFRENVEGNYWFPTYTRSNDVLHFSSGDIPIRMTVRYENYKRFGVTVKIGTPAKTAPDTQK
jgi:hypothetical protein